MPWLLPSVVIQVININANVKNILWEINWTPFININTCLSSIPNVNNRDSLLPGQRINVDLVGIAASVSFLFGLGKLREEVVLILLKDKNKRTLRNCTGRYHINQQEKEEKLDGQKELHSLVHIQAYP